MPMKLGTLAKERELRVLKYLKKHGVSTTERIQIDLIKKIHIDSQRVFIRFIQNRIRNSRQMRLVPNR